MRRPGGESLDLLTEYRDVWLLGAVAVNGILLILILILFVRVSALRKRLRALLGNSEAKDIEEAIIRNHQQLAQLQEDQAWLRKELGLLAEQSRKMKAKAAVVRYNAFQETGSDLSFSVAIVDEAGNGLVLTGIHHRTETQMYAKSLENGRSKYHLSPEEIEAINQALQS